ncbi:hypothetical protein OSTOST_02512 [Ostertagia ostertagi]
MGWTLLMRPSEPVVEVPPPEPAVQVQRPSEPVVELPPPTEPAAEVQRPSEPVTEALPPPEPAVEVAPAVMPTSDKHEYSLESSPAHSTAIEPSQSLPEQSAPSPDNGYAIAPSTSSAAQPAPPPSEHYTEEQLPAVAPAPTSAAPLVAVPSAPSPDLGHASEHPPEPAASEIGTAYGTDGEATSNEEITPSPSNNVYSGGNGAPPVSLPEPLPQQVVEAPETKVEAPVEVQPSAGAYVGGAEAVAAPQPPVPQTVALPPPPAPSQPITPEEGPVAKGENIGGNEAPAPSNSYSEIHEAAPPPSSSLLPMEPNPTVPPATIVVVTTTQQAFVQQPDSGSAESSYTNLNEGHSEPHASLIPVPAPASTYTDVKPSSQTENAASSSAQSPSYENNGEPLPVESYGQNGYVAPTTTPEPELRPEAIIHPATTTLPTPGTSASEGVQYINASPAHGSEQSYSGTSQQVSYVPETSPQLPEESEPEEQATSNAVESSYNNLEEDHGQPQGPVTVIDTEKTGNTAPQVNQQVSRPAYGTRPKIQVNPSSYKTLRPYAPRPYIPRPALTQSVEKYKESFVPQPLPPPPGPAPAFPLQPSAPVFPPSPSVPQFPPVHQFQAYSLPQPQLLHHVPQPSYAVPQNQGCCGGQLVSSRGDLCMPMNFSPCGGGQSFQGTAGGCGNLS